MFGIILKKMNRQERKKEYNSDIVYGTMNEFISDYLNDNTTNEEKDLVQGKLEYAEILSKKILEDLSLDIKIYKQNLNNEYAYLKANAFVRRLKGIDKNKILDLQDFDFIIDKNNRKIKLTNKGIKKLEENYEIEKYTKSKYPKIAFFVENALLAQNILQKDVDYTIENNEIKILSLKTIIPIQSIEAKEHLKISPENNLAGKISYREYLSLYNNVSISINNKHETMQLNANDIFYKKRKIIYKKRKQILQSLNLKQEILKLIDFICQTTTNEYYENKKISKLKIDLLKRFKMPKSNEINKTEFENRLKKLMYAQYAKIEEIIGDSIRIIEKQLVLRLIDENFVEFELKAEKVKNKNYNLEKYNEQINKLFNEFIEATNENIIKNLLFAKKQDKLQ